MRNAILDKIAQFEDYSELHRQGVSISEIRTAVKETLAPFIRSSDILESERVYYLAGEAINIRRISLDPSGPSFLRGLLDIYWAAYRTNPSACTSLVAELDEHVEAGKQKYISISVLERDKTGMDTETLTHEVFQLIGTTIEGAIRPFLDELLCLFHVCDRRYTPENTLEMALGDVVAALQREALEDSFLLPGGYGVPLSQWRNIAQHLSFAVGDDQITVTYGRNRTRKVILSRDDLMPLLRHILLRLAVLKAARVLFTWDNVSEIGPKLKDQSEHPDSLLTDLSAIFLTQGFRICQTDSTVNCLRLTVEDLRAEFEDPNTRAIHASQFLGFMAHRTHDKALAIEYVDPHRGRTCEFSITLVDAQAIRNSDNPLRELANRFTFRKGPNKAFEATS